MIAAIMRGDLLITRLAYIMALYAVVGPRVPSLPWTTKLTLCK